MDKAYFDEHFGPFYRINMMIITQTPGGNNTGTILTQPNLIAVLELMQRIEAIVVPNMEGGNGTLDDLCNKPVPGLGCMVQSILEFWQEDLALLQALHLIS